MSTAPDLNHLRALLEARFPSAIPRPGETARRGIATGIGALDRLLPGGLPRGGLSVWSGAATAGRTAAVRVLVGSALERGLPVAVIDARRELDASAWAELPGALWMARPPCPSPAEGAWAAEALLRSGAFALLVLDGVLPEATEAHRLRSLARDRDTALLCSAPEEPSGWRADVRVLFRSGPGRGLRAGGYWIRAARLAVVAGARPGEREVELVHEPPHRLRADPRAPDRTPGAA